MVMESHGLRRYESFPSHVRSTFSALQLLLHQRVCVSLATPLVDSNHPPHESRTDSIVAVERSRVPIASCSIRQSL